MTMRMILMHYLRRRRKEERISLFSPTLITFVIILKQVILRWLVLTVRLVRQPGQLLLTSCVTLNNIKVAPVSDAFLAQQNHDLDPNTVQEARRRHEWPKWKGGNVLE